MCLSTLRTPTEVIALMQLSLTQSDIEHYSIYMLWKIIVFYATISKSSCRCSLTTNHRQLVCMARLNEHVSTLCLSFLQRWSAAVGVSGTVYVA